jgi:hypothetical protein
MFSDQTILCQERLLEARSLKLAIKPKEGKGGGEGEGEGEDQEGAAPEDALVDAMRMRW